MFNPYSERRISFKWHPPRQHLVQDDSQGIDIRPLVHLFPSTCSGLMYSGVPMITPSPVRLLV